MKKKSVIIKRHPLHYIEERHRPWFVSAVLLLSLFLYLTVSSGTYEIRTLKRNLLPLLEGTKYSLDNELVALHDGWALTYPSKNGQCSKVTVSSNPIMIDLNADGLKDLIFIMNQTDAQGRELYYVAYAMRIEDSYVGSNTVYIETNVDPEILVIGDKEVAVNYVGKQSNVGQIKYFVVRNNVLVEVVK